MVTVMHGEMEQVSPGGGEPWRTEAGKHGSPSSHMECPVLLCAYQLREEHVTSEMVLIAPPSLTT